MHLHRLMAIVGAIIGVIGLFFSGLSTDGEAALPALSQASDAFPSGIPTIWGGLDTWAQVVLVIIIVVIVGLALSGRRSESFANNPAMITTGLGVVLLAYAIVKYLDASDSADTLQGGFAQAASAGVPGVQAWSVMVSIGFFVLMLGTVVVALAGILSRMSSD